MLQITVEKRLENLQAIIVKGDGHFMVFYFHGSVEDAEDLAPNILQRVLDLTNNIQAQCENEPSPSPI